MTLRHTTAEGSTDRIVDPADVQKALASDDTEFSTGFLPASVLSIVEKVQNESSLIGANHK